MYTHPYKYTHHIPLSTTYFITYVFSFKFLFVIHLHLLDYHMIYYYYFLLMIFYFQCYKIILLLNFFVRTVVWLLATL
jgi:hypothetical protein